MTTITKNYNLNHELMKKQQNSASEKLIQKFDNQLRDILAAELRSVKYARTKVMSQFEMNDTRNVA
jgi:hypothetical protein